MKPPSRKGMDLTDASISATTVIASIASIVPIASNLSVTFCTTTGLTSAGIGGMENPPPGPFPPPQPEIHMNTERDTTGRNNFWNRVFIVVIAFLLDYIFWG